MVRAWRPRPRIELIAELSMSTTVPPATPPAVPRSVPAGPTLVDENIRRTRRGLWLVDLGSSIVTLVIGVLLYLLAAAVIDQWIVPGGLSGWARAAMFVLLLGGIFWYAWRAFMPLLQPINPVYAAQAIEASSPGLKNSLLNLLLFRSRREKLSRRVYQAIEQQASERLADMPLGTAVDRTALLRLGYLLVAVIAVCAAYQIFSPKNPAISAGRILAPWADVPVPSRVQIDKIEPGDASVARGERLDVSAEVFGAGDDEPVRLHYSTVDRQIVDRHVAMQRIDGTFRYKATLPADAGAGDAGVQQDLDYWIEAGDARSSDYRVTVYARPTLIVTAVHYDYPAYTGYGSETIRDTGDIRAIEGTRVRIEAIANQPIETAKVDFDADGRADLAMQVDGDRATASFDLQLREDRRTPEHGSYTLRLKTTAGRENRNPPVYQIDVTPDYAPEIRQTKPEESPLDVRVDESVRIEIEARDPDFALESLRLLGRVGQRSIDLGQLLEQPHAGNLVDAVQFTPEQFDLAPGDVLQYWAVAADNRRPTSNEVQTPPRQLRIVGPGNRQLPPNPQQPDQQRDPQQQQEPGEGEAGEAGEQGQQGQQAGGGDPQEGAPSDPSDQQGQQGQGQAEPSDQTQSEEAGGQGGSPQEGQQASESTGANPAGQDGNDAQQTAPSEPGQAEPNPQDPASQDPAGAEQGQPGEQNQGEGNQQQPLSPEGDQDPEAFERIAEHFDPEQQDPNQQQQPGQQPPSNQQSQGEGEQQPSSQEGQPDQGAANQQQGQNQQQGPDQQPAQDQQQRQDAQQAEGQGDPRQGQQQDQGLRDAAAQNDPTGSDPQQRQQPDAQSKEPQQDATRQDLDQQDPNAQQQGDAQQQQPAADAQQQPSQEGDRDSSSSGQQTPEPDETPRPDSGQSADNSPGPTPDNPNDSQSDTPDGPPDDPSEQPGMANRNQGEPGDGDEPGEQQGAPEAEPKKPRDKSDSPDDSQSPDDASPPGESQGQQESDTQGEQSGDRSGEGQEGAGQQADAPGEGGAGENQPSESGSGVAEQPGEGETGQASGDTPGEAGERPSDNTAAAEQGEGRSAPSEGQGAEQSPTDRQNGDTPPTDAPGSSSSGAPEAGGQPGGQPGSGEGPDADPLPGDDPNLDYARQQTDLVLDRLEEQLAERKVDEDLLDKLGWSEEDLQQFVNRWKGLKERAAQGDVQEQTKLDDALRKLGLRRDRPQRFRAGGRTDSLRDLNEAYRARVPQKYRDRARAYVEGVSSGAGENADRP